MRIRGFRRRNGKGDEPARRPDAEPAPRPADPTPAAPPRLARPSPRPANRPKRDRRSRGLRGPLAPPGSPLARTRGDRFADLVLDSVERLERRWANELSDVEFAVEQVPPVNRSADPIAEAIPLSRLYPGSAGHSPRIVLYRRPIEARATGRADLTALVHDLVVEQVAELLGIEPEAVDPEYGLD
ncbi:MAG: metallopeptidase family protein [Sporichthyaceae bacterium]